MRNLRLRFFILFFVLCSTNLIHQEGWTESAFAFRVYEELKELSLNPQKTAEVKDVLIKKDAGTFHLKEGKIYLLQPIEERITGLVFIGEGIFEFTPPTEIEKYQLKRFTGTEVLDKGLSELYLRFTDDTAEKLLSEIEFVSGEVPGKAKRIKNSSEDRIKDLLKKNINTRILADLLADSSEGFFYAEINFEDSPRLFFLYDSKEIEEVSLIQPVPKGSLRKYDLVCSFHKEEEYQGESPRDEDKDEIRVNHYDMNIQIDSKWKLNAEVELEIEILRTGFRVFNFDLSDKLKISAILNEKGDTLEFIREKDRYEIAIVLPGAVKKGEKRKLKFIYSGDILDRNQFGDFYIRSATYWYPRYGYWQRSTFDLKFKTPKDFEFVTIGKRVKKKKEKDYIFTHWKEDFPVTVASFNLGAFDIYKKDYSGIPPVRVYYNEQSHRQARQVERDAHMEENIGADVVNSVNFFQENFGKCPFKKMAATEIPAAHGQGFPGLLHLSWGSFQTEKEFEYESFRAHEVAHQWWGHIVGWKTYHDQWLSEGFAEYSGRWFAQMSLKDNERFFGTLKRWEKEIIEGGYVGYGLDKLGDEKTLWGDGTNAGPLWLGYRLSSSKSEDYVNLVYQKGAYVLHMLRNMMMDFKGFSDEKFTKMMKDFVKTYYGKAASTEDFKRIVEKHTGEDMTWFFDQWVYGREIPRYVYSYSTVKVDDKFQVSLQVDQENVSPNFKMIVPVVVVFGDESYSIFRIMVDKSVNEIRLPLVNKEIKEIVFNPFHSVLCEVEHE